MAGKRHGLAQHLRHRSRHARRRRSASSAASYHATRPPRGLRPRLAHPAPRTCASSRSPSPTAIRAAAASGSRSRRRSTWSATARSLRYRRVDSNDQRARRLVPRRFERAAAARLDPVQRRALLSRRLSCDERSAARSRVGVRRGRIRRVVASHGCSAAGRRLTHQHRSGPDAAGVARSCRAPPARAGLAACASSSARASTLTLRARGRRPDRAPGDRPDSSARAIRARKAAEVAVHFGSVTTYTPLFRGGENVDHGNADAVYLQDDVSAPALHAAVAVDAAVRPRHRSPGTKPARCREHLLAGRRRRRRCSCGQRTSGLRGEGTASRNVDLLTRDFVPRESFNVGFNGQLSPRHRLSRSTSPPTACRCCSPSARPWTTRSTVRVTPDAFRPVPRACRRLGGRRRRRGRASRGTGTILGRVFTDWNGNGTQDPDEDAAREYSRPGHRRSSAVTTRRDGEFSFLNVPAGPQQVGLDTSAVPSTSIRRPISTVDLELDRGTTRGGSPSG